MKKDWILVLYMTTTVVEACSKYPQLNDISLTEEHIEYTTAANTLCRCGALLDTNHTLKSVTAVKLGDGYICKASTTAQLCDINDQIFKKKGAVTFHRSCCIYYHSNVVNYIMKPIKTPRTSGRIEFEVKLSSQLHFGLFTSEGMQGLWNVIKAANDESYIGHVHGPSNYRTGGGFQYVIYISPRVEVKDLFNVTTYRKIWIEFNQQQIKFGKDEDDAPITQTTSLPVLGEITHIAFTTSGGDAYLKFKCVSNDEEPSNSDIVILDC